jgi:hypothetical protein
MLTNTVFWNMMSCSQIERFQCFGINLCVHSQNKKYIEDGGSRFLRSLSAFLQDYTMSNPTKY